MPVAGAQVVESPTRAAVAQAVALRMQAAALQMRHAVVLMLLVAALPVAEVAFLVPHPLWGNADFFLAFAKL